MKRYAVVIEKCKRNYSAFSPDVLGCGATAKTIDAVRKLFREALAVHLEGTVEDGLPIPEPQTIVEYIDIEEPAAPQPLKPEPAATRKRKRA